MRLAGFALHAAIGLYAQSGVITTIAGAQRGFGGDDGPSARAQFALANLQNECDPARFEEQSHISVDRAGNILLADGNNHRIRRIALDGTITSIAGSGERPSTDRCTPLGGGTAAGDGGQARAARLYGPSHAIQLENGNLLICDQKNN
ncbi:MAG: hypothetical protein FJW32_24405, partial [Acidobacteria bacterium]|nr:hypothetical protein [Acidobacteriota bacterium]